MSDPDHERDPLDVLADEFTRRQRRGESPSISEYVTRCPELADEIRELFPAIATMERLKVHKQQGSAPRASLGAVQLESLGDFRIIGEIGRGGMGIVYEAFQESLGRHVAVKVLPRQSLLDRQQLQRFQREAQTAARLHHTNIVPVFGVGEHEGFHYIVMQLIRGIGLDAVLTTLRQQGPCDMDPLHGQDSAARRPSRGRDSETVALVEALVAGGFWQLHEVTPPTPQPAETVVCSPEGLAAAAEESSPPPSGATESPQGDHDTRASGGRDDTNTVCETTVVPQRATQLGPSYWRSIATIGLQVAEAMQYAHLQHTLHRDIKPANLLLDSQGVVWVTDFGLAKAIEQDNVTETGAIVGTLRYMAPEQLSGQFDARSDVYSLGLTLYELLTLQAAFEDTGRSGLIQKITQEEPVRPRKRNPAIPRDLETVILKSIAREPATRYQSAGEMAEDLQRFLEDRPVTARRITPPERLWRWCRRNPVVASLASAVLVMIVVAVAIASIGYAQTRKAWVSETQQRQKADQQRHKAEATTELAMEALDRIFQQFAPNRITDASAMTFEDSQGETVDVPLQPVISKETAAVLEQMLEFYGRLREQGKDDTRLRRKVADATRRVGDIRQRLGHFQQAVDAYKRAISLYRGLLQEAPEETELHTQIASIYNELGRVYHATDDRQQGDTSHRQALKLLEAAPSASLASPEFRYELARTYHCMGRKGPFPSGPPPRGRGPREPGPDRPRPFPPRPGDGRHEGPPPDGGPIRPLADRARKMFRGVSDHLQQQQSMQKAIELLETLADECPSTPEYRYLLAQCYRDMHPTSFIFSQQTALDANHKAIDILEALVDDFPNVSDFRHALSQTYADSPPPTGESFLSGDLAAVAEERFRKALKISEELVAEHPNVPQFAASQAEILFKLAETMRRTGTHGDAERLLRKALDLQLSLARRFPDVLGYSMRTTWLEFLLARLLREKGQPSAARSLLESSTTRLEGLMQNGRVKWPVDRILGEHYSELSLLLREMEESEAAEAVQRRAEERGVRLPRHPPSHHRDR